MKKLFVFALFLTVFCTANAGKVYKWVDENGQIHYSSNKPDDQNVKTVKIRKAPKVVAKKAAEEDVEVTPEAEEPVDPEAEKEAKAQMAKVDAANRKKQCETARKNLNALNSSTRVAQVDEETGARTMMTDAQRIKAFQQANKAVRDNCN
ncbi:DUF4124 domain-containing protein [Marinicella rhabdoformis]|uniref:DUF4124 domain-containing protein n=1 Tax=Marinicella rhabdoformis TaxID=2580566 RepID=UPI0015D060DD|nr:DUF4124 domain-containing protein [Marinicella rhabdoformis]